MPTSLVIELQRLAQDSKTDVVELLRRAIVVSSKLQLDDFNEWFEHELNGYPQKAGVPEYRVVGSRLMSQRSPNPPQPVLFTVNDDKEAKFNVAKWFATLPIRDSVSHIAHLLSRASDGRGIKNVPSESEMKMLVDGNPGFQHVEVFRDVSVTGMAAILDGVRNRILKWSLDLERKGILGDGMSFTKEEQATAAAQVTINGSIGSFVQGSGATVTTTQNSPNADVKVATGSGTINERMKLAVEAVRRHSPGAAEAIEKLADGVAKSAELPEGKKAEATETLAVIAEQAALPAEQRLQKVVLTPVVSSFRDNLSLSADLLQIWGTFGPMIIGWLGLILK